MAMSGIVVLGSGDEALGTAAILALGGQKVVLWEPVLAAGSSALPETPSRIRLSGAYGDHVAVIAHVTRDPFEALAAGNLLLVVMTPAEQAVIDDLLLPIVERRHVVALLPGNLGSLACAKWLRDRGRLVDESPTFVEFDALPNVYRRPRPDHIHVHGALPRLGAGVFPACRSDAALAALAPLFPDTGSRANVLVAALRSLGLLLRPPVALLNAGRFDRADRVDAMQDGVTLSVVRVIEAIDTERRAISAALGFEVPAAAETLREQATLWESLSCGFVLAYPRGPESLSDALSGDVPYGMRLWAELGEAFGVQTPAMRALLDIADLATGGAAPGVGRSLEDLGIRGMSVETLGLYLETGAPG